MASNISRKLSFVIASFVFMAISFFVYQKFTSAPVVSVERIDEQIGTRLPAVSESIELSIAVLPFSNASQDPDQQYLSDGLARELLDLLSGIPQLQVASRSSAFQFGREDIDIAEVAMKLDVANVLTGSVNKSGNKLQITTRLINAEDERVLWSETYDRPLDDIFAIQDDIAAGVVSTLRIELVGGAPKAENFDPDAYLLWLQGRYFYGLWGKENFERAVDANQAALRIDPDYVEAWASLAVTYLTQTQNGYLETVYGTTLARDAIDKALKIDPNRISVLSRLAHIQTMIEWDFAGAEDTLERALRIAPRDTRVLGAAAYLATCFGRSDDALAYLERALAEDPKNSIMMYNIAEVLHRAGRLNEAADAYQELLELNPQDLGTHAQLAIIKLQENNPEAAWRELELELEPQQQEYVRLLALPALGRSDEVEERLSIFIEKNQTWAAYLIASIYAWHGDRDNAFLWLDHAYKQHAATMTQVLLEPTLVGLHDDPRWVELLDQIGLPH